MYSSHFLSILSLLLLLKMTSHGCGLLPLVCFNFRLEISSGLGPGATTIFFFYVRDCHVFNLNFTTGDCSTGSQMSLVVSIFYSKKAFILLNNWFVWKVNDLFYLFFFPLFIVLQWLENSSRISLFKKKHVLKLRLTWRVYCIIESLFHVRVWKKTFFFFFFSF